MKVYRFRLYDVASEDFKISRRLATRACIKRIHAQIIKRTELQIDKRYLTSDGMTEIGFVDPEATRTYLTSGGGTVADMAVARRTLTPN
jgi:hypothetical protein